MTYMDQIKHANTAWLEWWPKSINKHVALAELRVYYRDLEWIEAGI